MWATRRATPADLPALRELCVASVGPDDYVLGFLERFVRDSVTYVALDAERTTGMMVYDDTPDGGAWLHAARTHPEYRRKGVASSLNAACERLARARSRDCLRLWASANNTASVGATLRSGFIERSRFTRMRIEVPARTPAVALEPVDFTVPWAALESSPILRRSAGYVFHDFYFLPMTRRNARWLAREGALAALGRNLVSLSSDYEGMRGKDLQIQPLVGDPAEILASAAGIARGRGADRVESFLPHDPSFLDAARGAGFEFMDWGQEAVLFEKPLRASAAGTGTSRPRAAARPAR